MTNTLRGHPIYYDGETWRFTDTGEPTVETWLERPCGHCGLPDTPEGHDGCLGTLPGVLNACCGHGDVDAAYVQVENGPTRRGREALTLINFLRSEDVRG